MSFLQVNQSIQDERKATNELRESLGLTERKTNAMAGELEESKALLDAAVRAQRQVEQELVDTREQVGKISLANSGFSQVNGIPFLCRNFQHRTKNKEIKIFIICSY